MPRAEAVSSKPVRPLAGPQELPTFGRHPHRRRCQRIMRVDARLPDYRAARLCAFELVQCFGSQDDLSRNKPARSRPTSCGACRTTGTDRYELDRGRLLTMTPARTRHGAVTLRLGAALANHVDASKAGVVLAGEPGFKLESDPDTVRAPDVAFIARDRIPREGLPVRFWTGAPDLAVEVLSPSDERSEVNTRRSRRSAVGRQSGLVRANPLLVDHCLKADAAAERSAGNQTARGRRSASRHFSSPLSRLFNFDL